MTIKTIDDGLKLLKRHYDKQLKIATDSGIEVDVLWVSMKYQHSLDVFKMAEYLVKNDLVLSKLDEKYKIYGLLGAILHDIGRAYKIGENKNKVEPHGVYGAEEILRKVENENDPFILLSFKYHDALLAEEKTREELKQYDLSNEEKEIIVLLLKLVMDSDKLANFNLFKNVDRRYFLSLKEEPYITESCFADFQKRNLVKREEMQTIFDQLLTYITWAYDLNFETSKKMALEKNYIKEFVDMMVKYSKNYNTNNLNKKITIIKEQLISDNLMSNE